MKVRWICVSVLIVTLVTCLLTEAIARGKISGQLLFADGSAQSFVDLTRITIDGQTIEGRRIKNVDYENSLLVGYKEKEVKIPFSDIREIEITSYDVVSSGENEFYLIDGTFKIVTKNKTYKNLPFSRFSSVGVKVLEELSGEITSTIYRAANLENGRPKIQIKKIILNN